MSPTPSNFVQDDGPDVDDTAVVLPSGRALTPDVVAELVAATRAASSTGGRPSLSNRTGKSPHLSFRVSDEVDALVDAASAEAGVARSTLGRDAVVEYLHNHFPHLTGKNEAS
jgi:hypothetical protein